MKRFLALVLVLVFCCSLVACNSEKDVTETLSQEMKQLIFETTAQALYDEEEIIAEDLDVEKCMQKEDDYTITGTANHNVDFEVLMTYSASTNTFDVKAVSIK